jgi:hypothetical protein
MGVRLSPAARPRWTTANSASGITGSPGRMVVWVFAITLSEARLARDGQL